MLTPGEAGVFPCMIKEVPEHFFVTDRNLIKFYMDTLHIPVG